MWTLRNKTNQQNILIDTENILVVTTRKGNGGMDKMGEGAQLYGDGR